MTFEEIMLSLIPSQREEWVEKVFTKERNHEWDVPKKKKFVREANRIQKENSYRFEPNSVRNITLGLLEVYQQSDGNLEETESILLAELISSFEEKDSSSIIETWNDGKVLSLILEKWDGKKEKASQFLYFLERERQDRPDFSLEEQGKREHLFHVLQTTDVNELERWSNQQLEREVIESLDRQLMGGK